MKNLFEFIKKIVNSINANHIGAYAATSAFFVFLSLVPIIVLIFSIISYTSFSSAQMLEFITSIFPNAAEGLIRYIVKNVYTSSVAILSFSAVAVLWSASKMMVGIIRGLNVINDTEEVRHNIPLRIRAMIYTLMFLAFILLLMVLNVFGINLKNYLCDSINGFSSVVKFFVNIRYVIVLLVLIPVFSLMFTFLPNCHLKFKHQIPGAVFAAVLWGGFSWGYSIFVDKIADYTIYGSLATVVVTMVWMYICMYILLLGAFFNKYFEKIHIIKKAP